MQCPRCKSEASEYHFGSVVDIRCWSCGHGVFGYGDEQSARDAFCACCGGAVEDRCRQEGDEGELLLS